MKYIIVKTEAKDLDQAVQEYLDKGYKLLGYPSFVAVTKANKYCPDKTSDYVFGYQAMTHSIMKPIGAITQ